MPNHDDIEQEWLRQAAFWKGFVMGILLTVLTAYFLVGLVD